MVRYFRKICRVRHDLKSNDLVSCLYLFIREGLHNFGRQYSYLTSKQVTSPPAYYYQFLLVLNELNRAFRNVLRDYKNLLQENPRTRIYETCTDRRNNSRIFPNKLFFIVVHISAARRCECM